MNNFSRETLKQFVAEAYKLYREGRLLELSTSQLAHSTLVEDCFLTSVPISPDVRGRTLRSILRWATDRLKPSNTHSWMAYQWRLFNTIYYFYFERMRVAELAERMAIAEQTLYQIRGEAMEAVAQVLLAELESPSDLLGRKHYVITDGYARRSSDEQLVLRLLAAFRQSMPSRLLHQLAEKNHVGNVQQAIHQLVASSWIMTNERGSELLLHPEVQQDLLTRLTPTERSEWHQAIGDYFLERRQYFEAAQHYFSADLPTSTTQIFVDHYQAIVNDLRADDMLQLISEIHPSDLDEERWMRLKIVAGDAAYLLEDVDTALVEYRQALGATDIGIKSLAYYRRAKVLELRNVDESLAHYAYGIQLLETLSSEAPLLVRLYIDRAILYMEKRHDTLHAERDLQHASYKIAPDARSEWSDLHSAWLRLCLQRENWDDAIDHGMQAWLAANEIQDIVRMTLTSHNLGMMYARKGKFDQANTYLERSLALALQVGNRQIAALNSKTIGGGLFMAGEFRGAETRYLESYAMFVELGNVNWQAHTCYDLAEVYGELGDMIAMRRYYDEGLSLARASADSRLIDAFEEFGRSYQALFTQLNPRQQAGLDHIQSKGKITNKQYQKLNDVSARQALRDLQELESSGILIKAGKGRATHYRLP